MRAVLVVLLWYDADCRRLASEDWAVRESAHARLEAAGVLALPSLLATGPGDPEAGRRRDTLLFPYRSGVGEVSRVLPACRLIACDLSDEDWQWIRLYVWDDWEANEEVIRLAVRAGWLDGTEWEVGRYREAVFLKACRWERLLRLIRSRAGSEK